MRTRFLVAGLAALSVSALAFAAVSGAYAWQKRELANTNQLAANAVADYREAFRLQIARNAGIKPDDSDKAIAEKLTRHLYEVTLFGSKPFASTGNNPLLYFQTINQEVANMCANLSATLVWSLDLFDIPARSIALASERFVNGVALNPTHALVEAKIDGEDIVFDPTFSTVYTCEGSSKLLDARGLQQCARANNLKHSYLSEPRGGRSMEEYPITLHEMSFAIEATERPDVFYTLELPEPGWRAKAQAQY